MASLSLLKLPISYLTLLFLFRVLPIAISQDPTAPTVAQCMTSLLPLASCVPFVQGATPTPPTACCDNVEQLYTDVPNCLCLLLNGKALSSFPINSTRALQLPDFCSLHVNMTSTCLGELVPPSPKVSPTVKTNSSTITNATVRASPVAQPPPKSSLVGLGLDRTTGASFKLPRAGIELTLVIAMTIYLTSFIF